MLAAIQAISVHLPNGNSRTAWNITPVVTGYEVWTMVIVVVIRQSEVEDREVQRLHKCYFREALYAESQPPRPPTAALRSIRGRRGDVRC